jgi:hypothetical protein
MLTLLKAEEAIKSDPKAFFGYVDLKKKRVLMVVWHLALTTSSIFLLVLYNEHIMMMYGCLLIQDQISCRTTHFLMLFSSLKMSVLLELDVSKGAGTDGIPPLILEKCASAFVALLFKRFLLTCVFPDRWTLSYVIPIFKKGRRNNKDYRGVAILFAILKRYELLVYRTMYDDLKNLVYLLNNMA